MNTQPVVLLSGLHTTSRATRRVLSAAAALLLLGPGLTAQNPQPAASGQTPPPAPWAWHNLRFEDPQAKPGVDTTHWWDEELRAIPLGDEENGVADWLMTVGGEIRFRYQRDSNKPPGPLAPRVNDYSLLRTRLFTDFRSKDGFRIFLEAISATLHGNSRAPAPIDRNSHDFLNAFVEFTRGSDIFKFGRSEMQYGAQRLISPLEWGNTRRTFEGAWWRNKGTDRTVDVFLTRPIIVEPHGWDSRDNSRWFGGVYATWSKLEQGVGDLYALVLDENDEIIASGTGSLGDWTVFTVGGRRTWKDGNVETEVEAAQQFGTRAGDEINAQMIALMAAINQPEWAGKPRFAVEFDYASGDDSPTDSKVGTFNQLFPLGHAYFGYIDIVGRQNIIDLQANARWTVNNGDVFRVALHNFQLADSHDALYGAGAGGGLPGVVFAANAAGAFGRDVGDEIDFTYETKPEGLAPHGHLLFGLSAFYPGRTYSLRRNDNHIHTLYAQFTFRF